MSDKVPNSVEIVDSHLDQFFDEDADIVVFDPNKKHTISVDSHHMNVDYSAYEGWELTGKCETVILRGKVAIEDSECKLEAGYGQFIARGKTSLIK